MKLGLSAKNEIKPWKRGSNECYVLLKTGAVIMSSVAFHVFMEHWMAEENQAKRKEYFNKMRERVSYSLMIRHLVAEFHQKYEDFHRGGRTDIRLWIELQNRAMMLIVMGAIIRPCRICGRSCTKYQIRSNYHLMSVCQNQKCKDVSHFILDLFR